jgi:hypothetical protein
VYAGSIQTDTLSLVSGYWEINDGLFLQ